jgi:hypothetical protein
MDNTPTVGEEQGGLDRRTVLRRGAILGGALVWTVPAVQTLAGPAFADGSACAPTFTVKNFPGLPDGSVTFSGDADCCTCLVDNEAQLFPILRAAFPPIIPDSVVHQAAELAAAIQCSANGPCKVTVN